jgi:hypothetical protein
MNVIVNNEHLGLIFTTLFKDVSVEIKLALREKST